MHRRHARTEGGVKHVPSPTFDIRGALHVADVGEASVAASVGPLGDDGVRSLRAEGDYHRRLETPQRAVKIRDLCFEFRAWVRREHRRAMARDGENVHLRSREARLGEAVVEESPIASREESSRADVFGACVAGDDGDGADATGEVVGDLRQNGATRP